MMGYLVWFVVWLLGYGVANYITLRHGKKHHVFATKQELEYLEVKLADKFEKRLHERLDDVYMRLCELDCKMSNCTNLEKVLSYLEGRKDKKGVD